MSYALIDAANAVLRYQDFDAPPALAPKKSLKWLPVEEQRPTPADGEILDGPIVTVETDKVRWTWTARRKTYAERLTAVQTARAAAYPAIGDQLDAAFKARTGDGAEQAAIDAAIQAVKAAHPKPTA